ncbi:hypothetical protein BH10PSE14_BH10PSE14_37400 [soil metagenome]
MLAIKQSATLFRRMPRDNDVAGEFRNDTVTKGPLIFVACGLLSHSLAERAALWIRCASGDFDASDAERIVRQWFQPGDGAHIANLAEEQAFDRRDAAARVAERR